MLANPPGTSSIGMIWRAEILVPNLNWSSICNWCCAYLGQCLTGLAFFALNVSLLFLLLLIGLTLMVVLEG